MKTDKMLNDRLVNATEVGELLSIATSTAYKRIRKLNFERKKKGFEIEDGKIPLSYIKKKYGIE